ncbi:hypothetical protein B0T13DRAFT_518289 [Neurospora crassa]|nr:hypothetical protein B0T13DRAFT_518289 [Neurospora crassa]
MTGKDLKTLGQELRRMERYQELTRMEQANRETNPWANAMHQDVHDSSSSTLNNKNNNNNNNPSRHTTELARSSEPTALPIPPDTPPPSSSSGCPRPPPPAYTPPPTAQARARARLGYVGARSSLPNTFSPWGEGTAGTDIDGLDIDRPAQDRPRQPPPYIFHARDRFIETGLPATYDSHTSSHTSSRYPYFASSPSAYGHGPYMAPSHPKAAALFGGGATTTTSDGNNRSAGTTTTTPRAPSPKKEQ